jgi:hypothetical protein
LSEIKRLSFEVDLADEALWKELSEVCELEGERTGRLLGSWAPIHESRKEEAESVGEPEHFLEKSIAGDRAKREDWCAAQPEAAVDTGEQAVEVLHGDLSKSARRHDSEQ